MKLDLSALVTAVASFEQSIAVVSDKNWFNSQPKPVQNTLVAGVIQNFEFVYELSIKMLRRRLEMDAATPTETDFADFRDLVRTGLNEALSPTWKPGLNIASCATLPRIPTTRKRRWRS